MSSNWIHSVDFCAANGLLDYDAPAYILGQPSRYIGNPKVETYMNMPPFSDATARLPQGPTADEFNGKTTPTWKKVVVGGTLLALAIGGILALKKGALSLANIKNVFGKIKMPSKASIQAFGKNVWDKIKMPFTYLKNKFGHGTTPPPAPPAP